MSGTGSSELKVLQVGRAVASIAVVLHHAELSALAFTSSDSVERFKWGAYGVDFFFVLSGFIIYYVHRNQLGQSDRFGAYATKRIIRIYIPYLPISIAMIGLYTLFPQFSHADREWSLLTSLTLIPSENPPALSVAWTLVYEMVFYAVFSMFFIINRFYFVLLVWFALVLTMQIFDQNLETFSPFFKTILNPLILLFLAGMLAALVFVRVSNEHWFIMMMIGAVCTIFLFSTPSVHRVFFGICLTPVLLSLIMMETRYEIRFSKFFVFLGSASYAIYLIHNPVQSLLARLLVNQDSYYLTLLICTFLGIGAGVVYHVIFERPVLNLLRKISIGGASSTSN